MEILTQRLVLRELRESDRDAFYALYSDAAFRRYEGSPLSKEEACRELQFCLERARQEPRKQYRLAVTIPPEDRLQGYVHMTENIASICEWEIGWGMHPALWGKGYATEAARELLRFAFDTLHAHRVVAFCHADNLASVRVMEKLGMRREGRLRAVRWLNGQWWDEYVYGILDQEG